MRFRLRTLMIILALGPALVAWLGPPLYELVLDQIWTLTGHPTLQTLTLKKDSEVIANGKSYGYLKPGERVGTKSRGRVYFDGKLRQPKEP